MGALAGINVFVVLISGIALSLIVGVATGSIGLSEIFNVVGDGVTGMYDITVISIIVACIVSLCQRIWWNPVHLKSDQKQDQRKKRRRIWNRSAGIVCRSLYSK